MKRIINLFKNETVLVISVFLAVLSCFFVTPSVKYIEYIDFKVLACLFCLMIVVSGLSKINILDIIAQKLLSRADSLRKIYLIIIFLTFFAAMFITNDVALITFVPLTLTILKMCGKMKYAIMFIVLQTIAANLGSSLTPVGNPQNLYLFSYYSFEILDFFKITLPIVIFSGLLLGACAIVVRNEVLRFEAKTIIKVGSIKKCIVYIILFIISVLCVFNIIPYQISMIIIIITVLLVDKSLFIDVDYSLLITFVSFFVFVGNISNIESLKTFFAQLLNNKELFSSILISQVISNVPAAILLSNFTDNAKEILLGVNIGGLGTLIASLASVISYKIYCKEKEAKKGKYMLVFTMYNIVFLLIITLFAITV